ncbi:MAG TPA: hypothetical protein VMZ00_09385 [Sporichthya sp.]|nr:hypothetical protein [Sporichthya sp.]
MTATDPFTTPVEAEREARVKQVNDLLAYAAHDHHFYNPYLGDDPLIVMERHAASVLYASQAATAHAMLAVRDELADIAASLRQLAAMPAAVQWVGDNLTAAGQSVQDGLTGLASEVHDLRSAVEAGDSAADAVDAVALAVNALAGAVDYLAEPRPRWWHRWFRREPAELDEAMNAAPNT